MSLSVPLFFRRHAVVLAMGALLAVCLGVYVRYNQRYVGAVDWYAYYHQGLLLKQGRLTLDTPLPPATFPAGVPLGFGISPGGEAVPQYPPGYPLLLAAASVVGGAMYLMPLLGVASVVIFFLLARDFTGDRLAAVVFAGLWAFCPIVVYGSTSIMSDLPAALAVMFSYWLYRRGHLAGSAWALGFALCVRPTNALFLVVFAPLLWRDRRLVRFGLWLALPCALYGLYNLRLFGAPWRTGYASLDYDFVAGVFPDHLRFYLWQCLLQFSPVVLLLALVGLRAPRGESWFFVAWFAVFLLLYCFWRSGGDAWWWTRFLLPGFAPVFLLAALGFSRLRQRIAEKLAPGPGRLAAAFTLGGLLAATPLYFIQFGHYQADLWHRDKGHTYYEVVREIEQAVPPGSYIGSVEFSGAFRVYSQLNSFVSRHSNAPALVEEVLRQGHEAYVLVEPWNKSHEAIVQLLHRFPAEKVRVINVWGGLPVYRLRAPAAP